MISVPRISKELWPKTVEEYFGPDLPKFYELRNTAYYNLLQVEFQLAYHAHISIRDSDEMSVHERRSLFELLKEQKNEEAKAIDKATSKS